MRNIIAVPGPGNYNVGNEFNEKGNYKLAKFKNSGAPVFTRAGRDTNLDNSTTRKSKVSHPSPFLKKFYTYLTVISLQLIYLKYLSLLV